MRLFNITFIHSGFFFFVFRIKFGKTKQIVVALVTAALKAPLSVAKANGRIAGCQLYTCHIDFLFLNILIHISPYQKKSALPRECTEKMLPLTIVVTRIAPQ